MVFLGASFRFGMSVVRIVSDANSTSTYGQLQGLYRTSGRPQTICEHCAARFIYFCALCLMTLSTECPLLRFGVWRPGVGKVT
jgi:hypothetical protein